jgi:hypothetical protein
MQALANNEELASKAAVRAIMLMKQEALNIAFGSTVSLPPFYSIDGALSTSLVTSTSSRRPPLKPNTPAAAAPALGAQLYPG